MKVAAYDLERGLALRPDGFAQECAVDEVGMLLAHVRPGESTSSVPLRGVFSREDGWLVTGDLFRRDRDGDYWRVDGAAEVIRTEEGSAFRTAIRDALSKLPAVDLAVAYGVPAHNGPDEIAVAAITLRAGRELQAKDLSAALRGLERHQRPAIVRVVDRIPVTTWFRPLTGPLREQGVPPPDGDTPAFYRDASGETYRTLTGAAHRRLVGRAASKRTGRAPSKQTGRAASKQPARAASKQTGRAASKQTGRAASKQAGRAASKPTGRAA